MFSRLALYIGLLLCLMDGAFAESGEAHVHKEADHAPHAKHAETESYGAEAVETAVAKVSAEQADESKVHSDDAHHEHDKHSIVAAKGEKAGERELKEASVDTIDAVLVLDGSGSMRLTDPLRLRDEGARLFVQSLRAGDRLAIVGFSQDAKVVRPLAAFDPEEAQKIAANIIEVGDEGTYTDLLEGIKLARSVLEQDRREHANRIIVLMSDGKMDPDPSKGTPLARTDQLIETILPEIKASNIKVHTLAFSAQADKDILAEIAAATDGVSWYTPSVDKIHESYANLFLVVKKPQFIALSSRGFRVDPDIQEATFYLNREESVDINIIDPSGNELRPEAASDKVHWFKGGKFDVITVIEPEVGDWQVNGLPSNDSFATVLTDLRLITEWPDSMHAGDPALLQARLYETDKPIHLPEMTGVIKYAYQVTPTDRVSEPIIREFLNDQGEHGDLRADDGVFSAKVSIDEEGDYKLRIIARAPTFERSQQIPFRVKPRMLSLSVVEAEANKDHDHAEHSEEERSTAHDKFELKLSTETSSLKRVVVKLVAVDEKRKRYNMTLFRAKDNSLRYEAYAKMLPHDGEYTLSATLTGETKRGEVTAKSQIIKFNKVTSGDDVHGEELPLLEAEKEEGPPSPLIYIILVTLFNLGVGAAAFRALKQLKVDVSVVVPTFPEPAIALGALTALREKIELTEFNFEDPIYRDDKLEIKPEYKSGMIAGVVEQAASMEVHVGSEAAPAVAAATSEASQTSGEAENKQFSEDESEAEAEAKE